MRNPWQKLLLIFGIIAGLVFVVGISLVARGEPSGDSLVHMPYIRLDPTPTPTPSPTPKPPPTGGYQEFRGLWVTRWDWAVGATPGKIDEIVGDAAFAGFNVILFQVRGAADAYYASNLEPWGRLLTGSLGGNPGWDPLAYMVQKAHERGIQVHAYINVYPVWDKCTLEPVPPYVSPEPLYYKLQNVHGTSNGKNAGLQWKTDTNVLCNDGYIWATPASGFADTHYLAVIKDIADRYDIDGIHLDRIRYGGRNTSCDPVSASAYGAPCSIGSQSYADWQRAQVNGTVRKIYDQLTHDHPDMMLSAAVWHTYIDYWNWGFSEGYHDYYQDSKYWLNDGKMDAIMPMIYSSNPQTFPLSRWRLMIENFQNDRRGRFIVAGIGSNHYSSFSEIADRIEAARQIGTAGHALFSYGGLKQKGYFDDLAAGPYSQPASVPGIPWH